MHNYQKYNKLARLVSLIGTDYTVNLLGSSTNIGTLHVGGLHQDAKCGLSHKNSRGRDVLVDPMSTPLCWSHNGMGWHGMLPLPTATFW